MRRTLFILLLFSSAGAAQHPRLILDATARTKLRARHSANTAEWQALKFTCDALAAAPVYPQRSLDERYDWSRTGVIRTNTPGTITVGYQGSATGPSTWSYADLYELSICYHATVEDAPSLAATYGAQLGKLAETLSVVPGEVALAIAFSSVAAGSVTTVTAPSHGLAPGHIIRITGATGNWAAANGVWTVATTAANSFTFALDSNSFGGSFDGAVKRIEYIADTTWALGSAWQAGAEIDGAQSNSGQVKIRGLVPGGTILSGDSFNVNGAHTFVARCAEVCAPGSAAAIADATGKATVLLGTDLSGQIGGSMPNTSYPAGGLTDGWPVTYEIVLTIGSHTLPNGATATVSGVAGNTAANGVWVLTPLDAGHVLLRSSGPGNGQQTNEVWDAATNAGFGARFFGPFIAQLYDWYFDALTLEQKTGLREALKRWLAAERKLGVSFGLSNPNGNYFQGFMNCWVYGSLAIEPEDAQGTAYYREFRAKYFDVTPRGISDFFSNVQPDYMHGDGAGSYGAGAAADLLDMVHVMATATGYDPETDARPFKWAPGLAKWLVANTRPDLTGYNTRSINVTTVNQVGPDTDYVRTSLRLSYRVYSFLARSNDPFLPYFQSYLQAIRGPLKAIRRNINPNFDSVKADEVLMYDAEAPSTDYTTLPTHYKAQSAGEYTWRTDWSPSAVFASFLAGPYLDAFESTKDARDRGNLAISRGGKQTLLTNIYWEYARYAAYLFNNYAGGPATLQVQNILQVDTGTAATSYRQRAFGPGAGVFSSTYDPLNCSKNNPSRITRDERAENYTYVRAEDLSYNYPVVTSCALDSNAACCARERAFTEWTREVFHLGPRVFLVYDRSQVYNPAWDHWLAWHFPRTVVEAPASDGIRRYNVEDMETFADGPAYKGTVHTILPAGRTEVLSDPFPQYRYRNQPVGYRLEVHNPPGAAANTWLTMFEVGASAPTAYTPARLEAVNADAVQLNDSDASVVVFPRLVTATMPIQYVYSGPKAKHYITGLPPSTSYRVTTAAGGFVTILPGTGSGSITTSPAGVLTFEASTPRSITVSGIGLRGIAIASNSAAY